MMQLLEWPDRVFVWQNGRFPAGGRLAILNGKATPMSETAVAQMAFADLERLPETPYRQELLHSGS
jgi:hypothetical protein